MSAHSLALLVVLVVWLLFAAGYWFGYYRGRYLLRREAERVTDFADKVIGRKPCPECKGVGSVLDL